ncbi:10575_t:CDS:2, partial [Paraglomus occultum]
SFIGAEEEEVDVEDDEREAILDLNDLMKVVTSSNEEKNQ